MKTVLIAWTETLAYSAFVQVPDDFDLDVYDVDALATINTDIHYEGCEDRTVTDIQTITPPANEEVEEIEWEHYRI